MQIISVSRKTIGVLTQTVEMLLIGGILVFKQKTHFLHNKRVAEVFTHH